MMTATDVPAYLEAAGFLDPARIMDGPLAVRVAPGRAHNYLVDTGDGSGYFIKQRDLEDSRDHLANEASFWEMLQATSRSDILEHLPRLRHQNLDRGLLVFDLLPGVEDLQEHIRRTGRFSLALFRRLGRFCGQLHRVDAAEADPQMRLSASPPWILSIHTPGPILLEYGSAGNVLLVEEIQRRPELGLLLDSLRGEWGETAIIHGDMKWANVLVASRSRSGRAPTLTIIDWELGGRGDPLWDVAGILSNFLVLWINSIPETGDAPLAVGLPRARYPLAMIQPAIQAFWTSYVEVRDFGPDETAGAVEAVTRYTTARLIQWAYEYLRTETAPSRMEIALLDLSLNLSQRPSEGAAHVLGISSAETGQR